MSKVTAISSHLMLRAVVGGLALVFQVMRRVDPRFSRAVASFRAIYEFRCDQAMLQLVFYDGRIRSTSGVTAAPDYTIEFIDLPGALLHLAQSPNDVLRLQLENKVSSAGNLHYLFRLGYLLGLATRWLEWRSWLSKR